MADETVGALLVVAPFGLEYGEAGCGGRRYVEPTGNASPRSRSRQSISSVKVRHRSVELLWKAPARSLKGAKTAGTIDAQRLSRSTGTRQIARHDGHRPRLRIASSTYLTGSIHRPQAQGRSKNEMAELLVRWTEGLLGARFESGHLLSNHAVLMLVARLKTEDSDSQGAYAVTGSLASSAPPQWRPPTWLCSMFRTRLGWASQLAHTTDTDSNVCYRTEGTRGACQATREEGLSVSPQANVPPTSSTVVGSRPGRGRSLAAWMEQNEDDGAMHPEYVAARRGRIRRLRKQCPRRDVDSRQVSQ